MLCNLVLNLPDGFIKASGHGVMYSFGRRRLIDSSHYYCVREAEPARPRHGGPAAKRGFVNKAFFSPVLLAHRKGFRQVLCNIRKRLGSL